MPACARKEIVLEGEVAVYHLWTRCVRRSFLCGDDERTGRNFDHRRDWIRDYLPRLAQLFGVEVGFHAELSNHLHLVVRTRPDVVQAWSDEEVVRRWLTVSRLTRSRDGQTIRPVTDEELAMEQARQDRVAELRGRLASVSQLMKALCEHIARRANREDRVTGAFFESRFKARRLEHEGAILVCGIYVDLNQIRAGEALTPEESTRTSAYDRIRGRLEREASSEVAAGPCAISENEATADSWLCELTLNERAEDYEGAAGSVTPWRASDKGLLPIRLEEYLELLDWTGRTVREGNKGAIPAHFAPILERLGISRALWLDLVTRFDGLFGHVVGQSQQLVRRAAEAGRRWYRGRAWCQDAFG